MGPNCAPSSQCPSDFDGVPWSFVTDTIAMFRPQCTDSPAQFVYAFT